MMQSRINKDKESVLAVFFVYRSLVSLLLVLLVIKDSSTD